MTFIQCFVKLLPLIAVLLGTFAVTYPALMIGLCRLAGSKLTVREILRRI